MVVVRIVEEARIVKGEVEEVGEIVVEETGGEREARLVEEETAWCGGGWVGGRWTTTGGEHIREGGWRKTLYLHTLSSTFPLLPSPSRLISAYPFTYVSVH